MVAPHLACDCGAATVAVAALPAELNACSCRFCARMGARWGHYPRAEVTVTGATVTYRRAERVLDVHHCPTCGCLTHWTGPNAARMGVDFAQAAPELVAAIPVVDRYTE